MKYLIHTLLALAAGGAACQAPAAEPLHLRMADSLPGGHIIAETSTKPWMALVAKLSGGAIAIDYYPSEQMGKAKDMLMLTQSGVIDIGYIGPAYVSDKMPLSAVAELPGSARSACEVMNAYWKLAKPGGYLFENEYKRNRIRPLFLAALPPYQMIIGSNRKLAQVGDVTGFKLRASGGAQDFVMHELGVVPVHMAPPGIYESMARGTIDGALLAFVSVDSYKLDPLVKAATVGANFGTVVVAYSIGERKWAKLPASVQEVLVKAGDAITQQACATFDAREKLAIGKLQQAGVRLVEFREADKAQLDAVYAKVARQWAASLDKRGKPGTDTLKAYRAALAEGGSDAHR
jgi:TRAP-type C4-dicarboxylate transport system substrate-binding protein